MTNTWPSTLPQCPLLNNFSEERQVNVASFQGSVGTAKMRRRSTAVSTLTAVAFRLTSAQRLTFNTFFETTLADGTLPFEWLHPITKVNYTWIFRPEEVPKIDRMTPGTFRVSFNLLRLP